MMRDLKALGVRTVAQLAYQNPQQMSADLMFLRRRSRRLRIPICRSSSVSGGIAAGRESAMGKDEIAVTTPALSADRRVLMTSAKGRLVLSREFERESWTSQRERPAFLTWLALSWQATRSIVGRQIQRRMKFLQSEISREEATLCDVRKQVGHDHHEAVWMLKLTLTSKGITAVLLKYRVPTERVEPYLESPLALQDAQRALGLVRFHAAEWHIDLHKIGVIGFSAGGHMVAAVSTHFDKRSYPDVDAADKESCRPSFPNTLPFRHMCSSSSSPANLMI